MFVMCLSRGVGALEIARSEGLLPNNRLGFIPTAGNVEPSEPYYVHDSRKRLQMMGFEIVDIFVDREDETVIKHKIKSVDGLFVAGGNTFYLMQELRRKNLVELLKFEILSGLPYFGESAGAVILAPTVEPFAAFDSPAEAPELTDYAGLGLVDFLPLPHVNQAKYEAIFARFISDNESVWRIVPVRDDQALVVRGGGDYETIDSPIADVI
jgi:dipeptidase E